MKISQRTITTPQSKILVRSLLTVLKAIYYWYDCLSPLLEGLQSSY